jgi:hypothetical protein
MPTHIMFRSFRAEHIPPEGRGSVKVVRERCLSGFEVSRHARAGHRYLIENSTHFMGGLKCARTMKEVRSIIDLA